MKFNKLAKELDYSVKDLADKVPHILPNANGGTEVSDEQKAQIIAHLEADTPAAEPLPAQNADPVLSILQTLIESETQQERPEEVVGAMIARYITDPTDLPTNPDYRAAIITYVELLKKRQMRKQQQSMKLQGLLQRYAQPAAIDAPIVLESFYDTEASAAAENMPLSANAPRPQLSASSS